MKWCWLQYETSTNIESLHPQATGTKSPPVLGKRMSDRKKKRLEAASHAKVTRFWQIHLFFSFYELESKRGEQNAPPPVHWVSNSIMKGPFNDVSSSWPNLVFHVTDLWPYTNNLPPLLPVMLLVVLYNCKISPFVRVTFCAKWVDLIRNLHWLS